MPQREDSYGSHHYGRAFIGICLGYVVGWAEDYRKERQRRAEETKRRVRAEKAEKWRQKTLEHLMQLTGHKWVWLPMSMQFYDVTTRETLDPDRIRDAYYDDANHADHPA